MCVMTSFYTVSASSFMGIFKAIRGILEGWGLNVVIFMGHVISFFKTLHKEHWGIIIQETFVLG